MLCKSQNAAHVEIIACSPLCPQNKSLTLTLG